MSMHNPPHPGEFIRSVYLEPFGMSARSLAESEGVLHELADNLEQCVWIKDPDTAIKVSAKPTTVRADMDEVVRALGY